MKILFGIFGTVIGLFLIVQLSAFRTVSSGEVAVVTRFGEVTGRTLGPGAHFISPFIEGTSYYNTKKITYETAPEAKQGNSEADYKDFPVDTNTEDGQPVDVSYTIRFSVDPTKATWIAQNIGSEQALVEKIVKTESRIWARNIPRRYSAENLYTGEGSQNVQNEIFDQLKGVFEINGLILDTVGIREIAFDVNYTQAIQAKQVEAVKVDTAKNIADRAAFEKEATIRQAEAQAEAQRLQSQTITPQFTQIEWIKRWNGVLPVYMTGDSASLLLQLPK